MTNETNIQGKYFFVDNSVGNIVSLPAIPSGEFAGDVYALYEKAKAQFGKNPNFSLQLRDGEIIRSTLQDSVLMAQAVAELGLRTALPSDFKDKRVLQMAKGSHYFDSCAVVLRGPTARWYDERAKGFVEDLEQQVDVSKLEKTPALVAGLKVVPADDLGTGYGFRFVPSQGDKFNVVYSDTLLPKFNKHHFTEQDENSLPLYLDRENGERANYTSDSRASRFSLGRNLSLGSLWDRFDSFGDDGRVPLFVADAVGSPKISELLQARQRNELLTRLGDARKYLEQLEAELKQ